MRRFTKFLLSTVFVFSSFVSGNTQQIYLSSYNLDFDSVEIGESKSKKLTVYNYSDSLIYISDININNAAFDVSENEFQIESNHIKEIYLSFSPNTIGDISGVLTLDWTAPDSVDNNVILYGKGIESKDPLISVSPDSLQFGNVKIDSYKDLSFTIYNGGDDTLLIENYDFDVTSFRIIKGSKKIIPSDSSVHTIRFSPKSIAHKKGYLNIYSNDLTQNPKKIYIEGKGKRKNSPLMYLSKNLVDLGNIYLGDTFNETIQVYNKGADNLIIYDIKHSITNLSVELSDSVISPSGQGEISLKFEAKKISSIDDLILIYSNDIISPVDTINFTGKVKVMPQPEIRTNPDTLDFRYVFIDTIKILELKIYNDGELPLKINSIIPSIDEITVNKTNFTINPEDSTEIEVTFSPKEEGEYRVSILINSNDPDTPTYKVILIGNGKRAPSAEIIVYPSNLDFGEVELNTTSEKYLYLTNDGELDLIIEEFIFSDDEFSAEYKDLIILSGSTDTLSIKFTPSDTNTIDGWTKIKSNATDSVIVVNLKGTGLYVPYPVLVIDTTYIDFGDLYTDETDEYTLKLINSGDEVLNITDLYTNLGALEFDLTSNSIQPNSETELVLKLNYQNPGSLTDTLYIESNNKYGVVKVVYTAMINIRYQAVISVENSNIDFGKVEVNKVKSKEIYVYNNGNIDLHINNILVNSNFFRAEIENNTILPSDSIILTMECLPKEEIEYECKILLENDSVNEPNLEISLQGKGYIPEIIDTVFVYIKFNKDLPLQYIGYFLEGETYILEDIYGNYSYLNGSEILFPEGSLKKNLNLQVSVPFSEDISKIEMNDRALISIVKFSNLGDSITYFIRKPFYVEIPVDLTKLELYGIDRDSVTMSVYDGNFKFDNRGVEDVNFDFEKGIISGKIKYLSILAVTSVKITQKGYKTENIVDLKQNFPNPFNSQTVIRYKVNREGEVSIDIYNNLGQHIVNLTDKYHRPGFYIIRWDGRNKEGLKVSSGVYYYRIKSSDYFLSKSMLYIK